MDGVETIALDLGFERILEKKSGKRIGAAMVMPGPTKLIRDTLKQEFEYRILSGISHGQSWALLNLGFNSLQANTTSKRKESLPTGANSIERNLEPIHIIYFCTILAKAFMKTINYASIIFGWDKQKYLSIIKEFTPIFGFEILDLE